MKITYGPKPSKLTNCSFEVICDPASVDLALEHNRRTSRMIRRKVPTWVTADMLVSVIDNLLLETAHIPVSYLYYARYTKRISDDRFLRFYFSRERQAWFLTEAGEGQPEEGLSIPPYHQHFIEAYTDAK